MITTPPIFDQFAGVVLPRDISEADRERFRALARDHIVASGNTLLSGPPVDRLVFVGNGAVKLVAHASGAREQVIAFYFKGDFFVLPEGRPHRYSLHALCDCALVAFPFARFTQLALADCRILKVLLDRNILSLERSREKAIALGRKTASERLAGFLLAMAQRLGRCSETAAAIDLPMSRRDIADSLGLTIETISRQFTVLRELNIIETVGKSGVQIRDLRALQARAGFLLEVA